MPRSYSTDLRWRIVWLYYYQEKCFDEIQKLLFVSARLQPILLKMEVQGLVTGNCFSPSFILTHNSIPMDTALNIRPLLNHVLKRRKPLGSGKVNHQPTRNTLGEGPR